MPSKPVFFSPLSWFLLVAEPGWLLTKCAFCVSWAFLNLPCNLKGPWVPLLSMVPKILPCTILHIPSFLLTWCRYSWWPQNPCVEDWRATEWKQSHSPIRTPIMDFMWVRNVLLLSLNHYSFLVLLVTASRSIWTNLLLTCPYPQHWMPRAQSLDFFSFYPLSLVTSSSLTPFNTNSIFVSFILPAAQAKNHSWAPHLSANKS